MDTYNKEQMEKLLTYSTGGFNYQHIVEAANARNIPSNIIDEFVSSYTKYQVNFQKFVNMSSNYTIISGASFIWFLIMSSMFIWSFNLNIIYIFISVILYWMLGIDNIIYNYLIGPTHISTTHDKKSFEKCRENIITMILNTYE